MNSYNSINILMKEDCFIEMSKLGNYDKSNLKSYQQLIGKLIYLLCRTKTDIAFAVSQ